MPPLIPASEFLDELFAFDPRWQSHYDTMQHAAQAAGLFPEFQVFSKSPQGKAREALSLGLVPDYASLVESYMAAQERLIADMMADLGHGSGVGELTAEIESNDVLDDSGE